MDFGRITLERDLVLYVFGTPGQQRFWFMWDDLVRGAIGAVVLADTRRLADCFPALDYFESCGLPYTVAVNQFEGTPEYDLRRRTGGARRPQPHPGARSSTPASAYSVVEALLALVTHAMAEQPL